MKLLQHIQEHSKMTTKSKILYSLLLFFLKCEQYCSQDQPNTTGYACKANQTSYPCQAYVFYKAMAPGFLDLASIGDLFLVSRLMIAKASNVSSPGSPLIPDQSLFVPVECSCNRINSSVNISYAALNYTIKKDDTFYHVSTNYFQNLTSYQSVEVVNPNIVPTRLQSGDSVVFPIFCKCPDSTQLQNQVNYLISYVFQPSDTLSSIASSFNTTTQSIIDVNGNDFQPFGTIFVPVSRLPLLIQPTVAPIAPERTERKGVIIGLAVGLGLSGLLLVSFFAIWGHRGAVLRKSRGKSGDEEKQHFGTGRKGVLKDDKNLIAEVSDCLDKYKVYGIDELKEATDGFDDKYLIEESVYRGSIDGELYAIKRLKWNAWEELKILEKVNHGNLVKLEGFCIDTAEPSCYLVYEYVKNGSLHSWLHDKKREKLNWKTRLKIAIDVANGLQYIHEHTRPRVVHKDIKSKNILLDSNMRAKIANFGLAKSGCNAITMHIVGTQGYLAPEYLSDGVVSTKLDVFALGVVLLELVSGREAMDEEGKLLWADVDKFLDGNQERKVKKVMEWMDDYLVNSNNNSESCSMESVMNVMAVAMACLHRDPSGRPSMVDVVYALCKSEDFFFDVSEEDGLSPPQVMAR